MKDSLAGWTSCREPAQDPTPTGWLLNSGIQTGGH